MSGPSYLWNLYIIYRLSDSYLYAILLMQPIASSSIHAVKSIVEMMIKIKNLESYVQDQLVLGQDLSIKVFNDACRWVRESVNTRLYIVTLDHLYYIHNCTMTRVKIKGTACSIYNVNHCLPTVQTLE